MTFVVKVPVLSEHILFAPPIVSHAYIFLTRFSSSSIFFTEKARDKVTASGSPSGIATTITVMAKMKKCRISVKSSPVFHYLDIPFSTANLIKSTIKIIIAEYNPNLPISSAIF